MAAKQYYLANALVDGWRELNEATQVAATIADGWIVSTGATNHSEYQAGTERAASTFTGTTVPDGTLDTTLKDAFRITAPITGNFAAGNWVFHFVVRAVTNGGAQDGRIRFRLVKADANGANATEITAAQQQASIVTNVSTSVDFDSTLTVNPGAFSITNQCLFIQIAWERTGAGGMTSSDIAFRTGSSTTVGTRITTADFTSNTTMAADAGSFAITGTAATLQVGRKLSAEAGSFAIGGQAVSLKAGRKLTAEIGSVAIAGQSANLLASRKLVADVGAFTVTGQAAALRKGFPLVAGSGSFVITGIDAGLRKAMRLTADPGGYALTGTPAALLAAHRLSSEAGSFTVAGTAATLALMRRLASASGVFLITGTAAGLFVGRRLTAAAGSLLITGTPATLLASRRLMAAAGAVIWTGTNATLTYIPGGGTFTLVAAPGAFTITGTAADLRLMRRLSAAAGLSLITGSPADLRAVRKLLAESGTFLMTGMAAALIADVAAPDMGSPHIHRLYEGSRTASAEGGHRIHKMRRVSRRVKP